MRLELPLADSHRMRRVRPTIRRAASRSSITTSAPRRPTRFSRSGAASSNGVHRLVRREQSLILNTTAPGPRTIRQRGDLIALDESRRCVRLHRLFRHAARPARLAATRKASTFASTESRLHSRSTASISSESGAATRVTVASGLRDEPHTAEIVTHGTGTVTLDRVRGAAAYCHDLDLSLDLRRAAVSHRRSTCFRWSGVLRRSSGPSDRDHVFRARSSRPRKLGTVA